ncbi:MAG TPA: hypothetical protein RMH99_32555 [Sandaracinaceae bacterium LLY-WYZ-13_1]|nr:hypothetical protein [Sandaracinaceae bacterium LLY-WYZ-13_1]
MVEDASDDGRLLDDRHEHAAIRALVARIEVGPRMRRERVETATEDRGE